MLWMLRGACLAHRQLDFSTMHTALLYVGTTLASVGEPCARLCVCMRACASRCMWLPAIPLMLLRIRACLSGFDVAEWCKARV